MSLHPPHGSFPLRIPGFLKAQISDLANREGISLNHLISLAVAEKIARMEAGFWRNEAEKLLPFRTTVGKPTGWVAAQTKVAK